MPTQPRRTTKSVLVSALVPSRLFRRTASKLAFAELVQSVRQTGGPVQNPLVRPLGAGRYEIVAGHQRWQAVKAAGLKRLRVDIKRLDDKEALLWMVAENAVRSNPNAVEQAEQFYAIADAFNPKGGGKSTTHPHLSERAAARIVAAALWGATHEKKSEEWIRVVIRCVPKDPANRKRLRASGAKVEHVRAAQHIVGRAQPIVFGAQHIVGGADIDSAQNETRWVDLAIEATQKGWSVKDVRAVGRHRYGYGGMRQAYLHPDFDKDPPTGSTRFHECPKCGHTWRGPCIESVVSHWRSSR